MIIAIKQSKLDKVDKTFFTVCAVTKHADDFENATNLDILLPTADLYTGRADGSVGKKKFEKKYTKYLTRRDTPVEWGIYSVGLAIANKANICLTCTDEEYDLGYLEILGSTIADMYGVQFETGYKEVKEIIETELDVYTKKERKLLNADEDELSNKKVKFRNKIIKDLGKALNSSMSEEGKDVFDEQNSRYAIDQLALNLMHGKTPVFQLNKDGTSVKGVVVDNYEGKTKDLVEAIMAPKDDEVLGKVIKKALKGYGVKYKKDDLKELGKEKLIQLVGQLYIVLSNYRSGSSDDED